MVTWPFHTKCDLYYGVEPRWLRIHTWWSNVSVCECVCVLTRQTSADRWRIAAFYITDRSKAASQSFCLSFDAVRSLWPVLIMTGNNDFTRLWPTGRWVFLCILGVLFIFKCWPEGIRAQKEHQVWTTGVLSNQQPSSVQWLEQLKITPNLLRIRIRDAVQESGLLFLGAPWACLDEFKPHFVFWRERKGENQKILLCGCTWTIFHPEERQRNRCLINNPPAREFGAPLIRGNELDVLWCWETMWNKAPRLW